MSAGGDGGGVSDFWGFVTLVGGALAVVLAKFIHGWREADVEEKGTKSAKVVLERADLVDISATERRLSDTNRLLEDLRPNLQRMMDLEQSNRTMIEANRERMDEVLRLLRKMDVEFDVAARLRQERMFDGMKRIDGDREG